MKKTFLLSLFCIAFLGLNAQTLVISNGEDTGLNWWQAGSTAVEIVDWHPKEGNTSEKSMTIWISPISDQWSGGGLSGLDIDVNVYNTISVLVYKNVTGTVRLELQDGTANYFVTADYTTASVWQKLEFTIPSEMGNITTLLIAPFIDYDLSTITGEESRCFWDEVIAYNDTTTGLNEIQSDNSAIVRTDIYTLSGDLIHSVAGNQKIDSSILSKGLYLIRQITETGNVTCKKVCIK
ncbi:MAG: T9SS type A sorting domain-containing protein [Paludibacter sp.]|nr:T9SS type A sorting domain-containing protein [Paludibacter sp.]